MRRQYRMKWVLLTVALISMWSAGTAFGAGFALIEQSASGMGNAFAGGAASAEDASTIFFNPAGLTRVDSQFIVGGHRIIPSAQFKDSGSSRINPAIGSLGTDNGPDGGVSAFVPNLYYSRKLGDAASFGLGVNVPFGLGTEYNSTWIGRYHAIKSDMLSLNINPSLGFKVTDRLSVGVGVSAMYIKAELTNAVDQKLILASAGAPVGVWSVATDALGAMEGDGWGYGFNAGILYEATKDTRFGLAYRSHVRQTLEGDLKFTNVHALLGATLQNRTITASVELPETASASVYTKIAPKLALMADVTWTNWSRFQELVIQDKYTTATVTKTKENWVSTYRYSAGLSYYATDNATLRFGVAYDETPIPNANYRTPRIPDEDRTWVAAGLGYKFSSKVSLDLGAAYLKVRDPKVDLKTNALDASEPNNSRGNLKGTYDADVKIVSAQLNWAF